MNKSTFFSVIIPVYNTKKEYLNECVQSVLDQQYSNYEIIIVNDGSNTETTDHLETFKNENIKLINQENQGVIKARINGLSEASGEFIVFVDSDDIISKDMLSHFNNIINKDEPDLIIFDSVKFKNDINDIYEPGHYFNEGLISKKEALDQLLQLHINSFSDKACKKDILSSMIEHIDTSIVNGEDLQQSTYLILNSEKIYYTDKPVAYYRIYEGERDYYDVRNINDINFLVPTYDMVFKDTSERSDMLPVYKQAAVNAVIYTAFNIIKFTSPNSETTKYLDELNKQKAVILLSELRHKISFPSQLLFTLLIKKHYFLLGVAANLYNRTPRQ